MLGMSNTGAQFVSNAPIKVNPVGGGVRAMGGDLMPETIPLSGFDRAKRPRGRDI